MAPALLQHDGNGALDLASAQGHPSATSAIPKLQCAYGHLWA